MTLSSNIITTLLARLAVLALALLSSMILARYLGPEGRGLFALILLLPELATTFGLLGFDHANVVYAGLEAEKRKELVWHSAVVAGVIGTVITVLMMGYIFLGAPGFPALAQGPRILYLLALSVIPLSILGEYWGSLVRGMNRIALMNGVEVGSKVFSIAILVTMLIWLQLGVTGAVITQVVLSICGLVIALFLINHVGILGKPSFDWSLWKRTARFAFPAYCGTLMQYLNYRVDQFFIAWMLPAEQLGFYVIAVALAERLWILTGAVGNALLPHLTNSKSRNPALAAVVARHVMLWTGAACLVLFIFADVLIRVLYSAAFVDAVGPLRWLLPGIFGASVGKILVSEILAREKVTLTFWVAVAAAIINIVGNILLIPRMGISGSALASSVSYSIQSIMITYYYIKITKVAATKFLPEASDVHIYTDMWNQLQGWLIIKRKRAEEVT